MYRIGIDEINELKKVIESGDLFKINDGIRESRKVEDKLKSIFKAEYSIFMTSGHAALTSALVALGIGPGDQVIVPAYTYIATAIAVVAAGAIPVIAEVDDTLTISPADIERKITSATKAVMPVHIQGFPCNMDAVREIAKRHNLFVIEDACQAVGGKYKDKYLGAIGDAGAFSFNYFKIASCGEGGGFITNSKDVFERALIYHDSSAIAFFGDQLDGVSTPNFCGQEFRSNEICAAVLNVQLDRLDGILTDLRKNKKYLMEKLSDVATFIPSNDIEGDCGTTLAFSFDSADKAWNFAYAEGIRGSIPIRTGKHVYRNWDCIMEKRGAFNPLMDPFRMEANKGIIPDYREDMCPETLDKLSKVVYMSVNPDATKEELDATVEAVRKAIAGL